MAKSLPAQKAIFTATSNTIEAAALGTCGVPVTVHRHVDEFTKRETVRWDLGEQNADGSVSTARVRYEFENGLEAKAPDHFYLSCWRGVRNFTRLLDFLKQGRNIYLSQVAPGSTSWQYRHGGEGLPGVGKGQAVITTGCPIMVSALGERGYPLLKVEGGRGREKFWVASAPNQGTPPPAEPRDVQAAFLVRAWRDGTLDVVDPAGNFGYAARAVKNWLRFQRTANNMLRMVTLRKEQSSLGAVVREDISGVGMDRVTEHFDSE